MSGPLNEIEDLIWFSENNRNVVPWSEKSIPSSMEFLQLFEIQNLWFAGIVTRCSCKLTSFV